ncbi:MAG: bile acid:sodium symporter family protein [Rhodobacterales bacterium]|nr:bile acid:sodium symporter family protein [Rhodobacterales bacterium]
MPDNAAVQYFLPVTIGMINLSLGLGLTPTDFRRVLDKPKAVAVGAVAQLVGLPALGFAFATLFGLPPELAVGLVLITACPGGAHSNLFANLARGDTALSVTLTAVSGTLTIGAIPLWMWLATRVFGVGDQVQLPILQTMTQIFAVVAVPLALGMLIRQASALWAGRMERLVKSLAMLLLLIIVVGSVAKQADQVLEHAKNVGWAVLSLHVTGMVGGFGLAVVTGLNRAQHVTVALEVGVQNSALAVGIAMTLLDNTTIAVPAIVYSLLVYATSTALVLWSRYRYLAPASASGPS